MFKQNPGLWSIVLPLLLCSCTASSESSKTAATKPQSKTNQTDKLPEKKPTRKENKQAATKDQPGPQLENKPKNPDYYKAWKVDQVNQIFGAQSVYLSKSWMITDNKREGTTYVRKVGDKHIIIYNTKKKVYFEGSSLNIMKRMELFTRVTNTDLTNLKDAKSGWKFERKAKLLGRDCKIFSVKEHNKTWKMWIDDKMEVDPSVYQDYLDWSKLPSVGGMPLKLVSFTERGKSTLYVDSINIKQVKVKASKLKVPEGFKRVNEIFQVSSGRTEQLMESFSEILGD